MLNVALVGLLAGSLLTAPGGPTDDDKDKKKAQQSEETAPAPGIFDAAVPAEEQPIIQDTYAFGRAASAAPIKFWASYAFGNAKELWGADGEERPIAIRNPLNGATLETGNIESQRITVGAEINPISFPAFKLGVGGELRVAQNKFKTDDDSPGALLNGDELSSGFKLQNGKIYASARGNVLGVHAGYMMDLGNHDDADLFSLTNPTGRGLANADGNDAIFVGANFDYPSEVVRLFGGLDYYHLQETDDIQGDGGQDDFVENANYLNFTFGGGVKFSAVEVGAAFNIVNRFFAPTVSPSIGTVPNIGSHAGTVSPYLRISPASLPASLFVQGGVLDEYNTYGYALGGANSIKPAIGFTAGLSIGFE